MKKVEDEGLDIKKRENEAGRTAAAQGLNGNASLAKYMTRLLQMPAGEEQRRRLGNEALQDGGVSQGMALAHAVLAKAIEKGDIAAFKAVKELEDKENGGSGILEEMIRGISGALQADGISLNGSGLNNGKELQIQEKTTGRDKKADVKSGAVQVGKRERSAGWGQEPE